MRGLWDVGRARHRGLLGALLGACLALGVVAAPASAEYAQVGTVGDATTLKNPVGVAIDEDTKDLYVGSVFAPGDVFAFGLAVKFNAAGDSVGGVRGGNIVTSTAVDQSSGNLYVLDNNGGSFPFVSVFTPEETQVGSTFQAGDASGGTSVQIAVDGSGVVYVPDRETASGVGKYNSAGVSQGTIDGSGENALNLPVAVALDDDGGIYVVDQGVDDNGTPEEPSDDTTFPRVQLFNSAGVFQKVISQEDEENGVAVDDTTGNVFVGKGSGAEYRVTVYDSSGAEVDEFGEGLFGAPLAGTANQLTVDSSTGKVYVGDQGNNTVRVFGEPEAPVATTGQASGVTQTGATLEGELNPGGAETDCLFLYGEAGGPLDEEVACETDPVSGGVTVDVSADVSGLDPNTAYEFRLSAENVEGSDEGDVESFTTLVNAPSATTGSASAVTQTAATLSATVNANGGSASCVFQYGTSTAYGSTAPCSVNPVTGSSATAVSAALSGLAPGTTYHYRVVAQNAGGTTNGLNQTFTTVAHTCETDASLCPKQDPPKTDPPVSTPQPPVAEPPVKPKPPIKCKKGFKKKKVKGKQKCVKVKAKKKGKKK